MAAYVPRTVSQSSRYLDCRDDATLRLFCPTGQRFAKRLSH